MAKKQDDYGSAPRLSCHEVWDWCELLRRLAALEELDIDYVVIRNRETEGDKLGWCVKTSRGLNDTISESDIVYTREPAP